MCLIIDANVASGCAPGNGVFSEDIKPIMAALLKDKIRCVSGYKHKRELLACRFRSIYRQLLLSGRLREIRDEEILREKEKLPKIRSNDSHILALSLASGARVLFSDDADLQLDFTDIKIIRPKGKLYKRKEHSHLLNGKNCKFCARQK